MVILRAFAYFSLFYGFTLAVVFSIFSQDVIRSFKAGLLGGFFFAVIMSVYLAFGLFLFRNRLLFYSNVEDQLNKFNVDHIDFDGVAGDTTHGRIKYGGLFLTRDAVIFIPHRFAIRHSAINLPLNKIARVDTAGINIVKLFSGGLGTRLVIETKDADKYEFRVWEPDRWIKELNERIKDN